MCDTTLNFGHGSLDVGAGSLTYLLCAVEHAYMLHCESDRAWGILRYAGVAIQKARYCWKGRAAVDKNLMPEALGWPFTFLKAAWRAVHLDCIVQSLIMCFVVQDSMCLGRRQAP